MAVGVLALAAGSMTVEAGNRSFTGTYSPADMTMPGAVTSCSGEQDLQFQQTEPFQVDQTGDYRIVDAGAALGFTNVRDSSIHVYEGSFDPAAPSDNLIALTDLDFNVIVNSSLTTLNSGTDYILVAQIWCEFLAGDGTWGAVIKGPGDFSGAGFDSNPDTFGDFANVTDTASFPFLVDGERTYVEFTINPLRSGEHAFLDIGRIFGESFSQMVLYEGAFNPANTEENLSENLFSNTSANLEMGTEYTLVIVDADEDNAPYQVVIYDAGIAGLGVHMSSSWFNPDTSGQGVLLDYGPNTAGGFLFLTWFTFENASSSPQKENKTLAVGATDQRWLTGNGQNPPGATSVDLAFNNTTGGVFNAADPAPSTDGSYGTGSLTIDGCNAITIDFDLPDGNSGQMNLQRALGQEVERCYEETGVGELRR